MIVHLRNAGFSNKGAELMLISAVRWLEEEHPESRAAVHYTVGQAGERRSLDLSEVVWLEHHRLPAVRTLLNSLAQLNARRGPVRPQEPMHGGAAVRPEGGFLPRAGRRLQMLSRARGEHAVLGSQVDVVLDLSGFAYGDPWGPQEAVTASSYYAEVRRRGGRVVLMPQQLGPFERPEVREAFHQLSRHCDLIFARDDASHQAAAEVVADPTILRQAPDFTILQSGKPPEDPGLSGKACIVPNFKMIEQRPERERQAYPEFLKRSVSHLRARNVPVFVLLHEYSGRDEAIARSLSDSVGGIDIHDCDDPLRLKGTLGASRLTIGSRFHGLVSALSQAVPSLATSWSHKYEYLFAEYGCEECLVQPTLSDDELGSALERVLEEPSRSELIATLRERNGRQRRRVESMWEEIDQLLTPAAAYRANV